MSETMHPIDPMTATPAELDQMLAAYGAEVPSANKVKLYDQDAPENSEGPIQFTIVEQTDANGNPLTGPNGTEVLPVVDVETVDATPKPKGILKGMRKFLGKRSASKTESDAVDIASADEVVDTEAEDAVQEPENAFQKVAREQREGRIGGLTAKERRAERKAQKAEKRAEKRKAADEALSATIDDQGNALPVVKPAKEKKPSKLGDRVRSLRNRTGSNSKQIAALEAELEGASSTIAVMKKDANGDKVYTRVHSDRTYRTNEQGKKVRMTNEDIDAYEQKVAQLNELREASKPKTKEAKMQPLAELSDEEFTAYLDGLTDEQTEAVMQYMDKNDSAKELLTNATNAERKVLIDALLAKMARKEGRGKLRNAPLAAVVGAQTAATELAENSRERMSGKKKWAVAAAIGGVAAVAGGVWLASKTGGSTGTSRGIAGELAGKGAKPVDHEHAGLIADHAAKVKAQNAADLAAFHRAEHAASALAKVKESLGINSEGLGKAQSLADKGKYSWTVANALSPGKESAAMQVGIDKFNQLNGTDFALQRTADGVLKIVKGSGQVVNRTEMRYINQLMINELS
jgi:hypothetical protein